MRSLGRLPFGWVLGVYACAIITMAYIFPPPNLCACRCR